MSEADDKRILGEHIRRLREATGKSYETVAGEADLHRNALGAIERGETLPRLSTLLKLARVLGIKPSKLLEPFD